jgi:outer membrane protein assembly factor BamD
MPDRMAMKNRPYALILVCLIALALPGCSSSTKKKEAEDLKQVPVETLYNKAAGLLDSGSYLEASKAFDDVDRQYPYSQWATKAQLMSGYAHYKDLKYDDAILSLDHFIELHPGDENAPYAWYLKALCYYEQITDVGRDQKITELALDALQQVVQRFPESKYAKDASLKIDLTKDHLAGKEMEIGRYYEDRKLWQAAINRFQKVVTQYQTTTHVPEALERMVESYLALGMREEAQKSAAILGHNFPQTSWYRDSYRLMGGKVPKWQQEQDDKNANKMYGSIFD